MATATPSQINFIKNLLADKAHTDNGKTITVEGTRFRTTADNIDQISTASASRLIAALKAAPTKPAADRTPEGPHFRNLAGEWLIAGVATAKPGDTIEVTTKAGNARAVTLTRKEGIMWHFTDAVTEARAAEEGAKNAEAADAEQSDEADYQAEQEKITMQGLPQVDWAAKAYAAGRSYGVDGGIWDD